MTALFATPQEAAASFYDAFQRGDLESMMEVWAEDERIACLHPGWTPLQGRSQIAHSWRQIFAGERVRVKLSDEQYTQDALLAIQQVRENLSVGGQLRGTVLATNVFQLVAGSWRMILHHGSALPAPESGSGRGETVLH